MYQDLVYPEDLVRLKNTGEIFSPIKDSSKENKTINFKEQYFSQIIDKERRTHHLHEAVRMAASTA